MSGEDLRKEGESIPAFGVSGQFMMTSQEKARPLEDFNPRKIVALTLDDSLARLFECLTLEYSGSILLTPKWKNFRSQKLKFAEKTRINNAIWRSWHIQFQECKRPLFCQFDNPLTEMAKKPRPVTLMIEGKYWKRKLEAVATEYQKWRVFYKQMVENKFQDVELQHQTEEILRLDQEISDKLREQEKVRKYSLANSNQGNVPNLLGADVGSPLSLVVSQALEMVDSCNLMENMVFSLPDTLFSSLANNQAMGRVRSGTFKDTADTVQPTLDTLQPSLEAMTPVLDELIEQLEASMNGSVSDLNWDFESLERSCEGNMGLVQSSSSAAQVEPMDHSGRYSQRYASIGNVPTSSPVKTSWPVQTTTIPVHSMYPASSMSQLTAQLPVWTSAPVIHPNVKGYQTIGNGPSGGYISQAETSGRVRSLPPVGGIVGSSSAVSSRTYDVPPTSIGKRVPVTPSACAFESSAGRMPRNSSDSQLYLLAANHDSPPSKQRSHIPIELQAPNLVAQLKLTKPRQMLIEEKAKRLRIPRNKSAPGLASLAESAAQLKKAPQVGGVRAKRLGRIPRNRSDSALASLIRQTEQSPSTARRDSESSDSPLTMNVTPSSGLKQGETFSKRQLYSPGGDGAAPSQLVNDMVSELMSKGISMEEILNKLTSMAAAGAVPQAQVIPHQITSAASSMASMLQEQQMAQQQATSSQAATLNHLPPPQPSSTDTGKLPTPRNRRKPQLPRSNIKTPRTESPAIIDRSGIRPSNNTVQSLLTANRQTDSRTRTLDSSSTVSNARWGNSTPTSSLNLAFALTHTANQYPAVFQSSTQMVTETSPESTQVKSVRTDSPSPGFLPTMVVTTSVASPIHTEAQSSSASKTAETSDTSSTSTRMTRTNLPKEQYKEHRRMVHVSAEQKRRGHIKMGFDQLVEMVPTLASQASTKISKATVLRKSVDYILQVQHEHDRMKRERDKLKREIEELNVEISNCQQQLPETGVMVNRQDFNELEVLFNRYIQDRTEQNPKFWIFSVLMRPIFDAYSSTVSTANPEEFYRTIISWLNDSCCLPKLRPSVLSSLRELIKNTSILSDPSKFPEQARLAANSLSSQSAYEGLPR